MTVRRVIASAFLTTALLGCDDRAKQSAPQIGPDAPATLPASAVVPATSPADSHLRVDGKSLAFPPARLKTRKVDGGVSALLFSNDPPEAIKDDYTGNSFYLEMRLDGEDPQDLSTAVWKFKAPSPERADSPVGVFLHGNHLQLQPADVRASFDRHPTGWTVHLAGQFLQFETHGEKDSPPKTVNVEGDLQADVVSK